MLFILLFEIIFNFKIIQNNHVILPFKEYLKDCKLFEKQKNFTKLLLDNYLDYKIYSEIKIGSPPKKLPLFINTNIKIFRIKFEEQISNFDFSKYDKYMPNESVTFVNISNQLNLEEFYFFGYSLINETIQLFQNENYKNEIEIKNIQLYSEIKKSSLNNNYLYSFAELGISFSKETNSQTNLLIELKNLGIINSNIITFKYKDNNEGDLIIGEYPHIYDNKNYDKNSLMTAYIIPNYGINNEIKIKMDKIYIRNEHINSDIYFENNILLLNYGLGIILSSEEYFNKILEIFFNKYIYLNICKINIEKRGLNNNYHIILCEKNKEFKINEFPSLYLFKEELDNIFELNYHDLFEEIDNIYYFLIIYFPFSNNNFELGKPFLKKYQMSYNIDMSTIHFYKNNNIIKNNNKEFLKAEKKNIIYLFNLIILFVILAFIYYKKINHKKRKLRKNELNETFKYSIQIDDIH